MLGGVADGISAFLDLPIMAVRLAFVVLALAGGVGIAVYAVLWVFLRAADGKPLGHDARERGQLVVFIALIAVTLVALVPLNVIPGGAGTLAILVIVAGVAVVWRYADETQRKQWRAQASGSRSALARLVAGGVLVIIGIVGFLASRGELANARAGLLSTAIVVGGIALLSSPWWVAMGSDLRDERRARIRAQEREEVAAHLHDSVLQTLTLIQKASSSPDEVSRLARRQERELRTWLYAGRSKSASLAAALGQVAADVESSRGTAVDVVVVGDCPTDEAVQALIDATREAVVNAAKHSGAPAVDVYAEVEDKSVTVFVRDRGAGFDPSAVPQDRHGLEGSVVGRMKRQGGTATIRSTPGEGTEVRLELPRD